MWRYYSKRVIPVNFTSQRFDSSKIRTILTHAKSNVEYYRDRIPVLPAEDSALSTFVENLNFSVSKADYLELKRRFIDQRPGYYKSKIDPNLGFIHNLLSGLNSKCLIPINSSGSTGSALRFYKTRKDLLTAAIEILQVARYHGWEEGESIIISFQEGMYAQTRFFHKLFSWFGMPLFLYQDININSTQKLVRTLQKTHSTLIIAFASQLNEFAIHCKKFNIQVVTDLKFIFSVGEMLFQHQRKLIEEVFRVKVYDFYGTSELGMIAVECKKQKGMHILENEVYLENDAHNNIIATSLNSKYMPFIKYKVGDTGKISYEKCSCGIEGKMIIELEGRVDDYLITQEGKHIYASYFRQLMLFTNEKFGNQIVRVQFRQKKDLTIIVSIQSNCDQFIEEKISSSFKDKIRSDFNVNVDIEFKENMMPPKGKFKFLIRE